MSVASTIVERYFVTRGDTLVVGGVSCEDIAAEFGTPVFVYDQRVLDAKWRMLRGALPNSVDVYYSVKANPNPALIRSFLDRGAGLEIASGGELYQVLAAGANPEHVVFAGPGKTDREIREFVDAGGGEIHVESLNEAARLDRVSQEAGKVVRAAVRVNPSSEAQGGAMRMGGKPAPFGADEEMLPELVDRLQRSPNVRPSGVHIFAGTQILDVDILRAQYRKCVDLAKAFAELTGDPVGTVDFGGGLGVPYFQGEEELDIAGYGAMVAELVDGLDPDVFESTRFIVEPGRYLVGDAGIYVTSVIDVKESRGKKFVVLDGGMNHHLAASGNLGQVVKRNFPVAAIGRMNQSPSGKADLVGPLCTPLDVLARNVDFPDVEPGDLVGVFQSGAYARTASPLGFLGHRTPAEVLASDGASRLVRARGEYADLTRDVPTDD